MLFIEARLVSAWVINIDSTAIKDQMVFFLNSHLCNGTRWFGETTMKIIVQGLEEWQKIIIKENGYFMFKYLYFLWKQAIIFN